MSHPKAKRVKKAVKYNKHLALEDRIIIEAGLNAAQPLKHIALSIGKDPTTVAKEIKRHRLAKAATQFNHQVNCQNLMTCQRGGLCSDLPACFAMCKHCLRHNCSHLCPAYVPMTCRRTQQAPYVCNGCDQKKSCRRLTKNYYYASQAQASYRSTLSESRKGINLTDIELAELDKLVAPLLRRGQALNHIYANHAPAIPCSRKTLYSYIDQHLLSVGNMDLPRKIRYKKRKKHQKEHAKDQRYRLGRTYKDFLEFTAQNPELTVVELDTVEGLKSDRPVLLTLIFRSCNCMLIDLLTSQTQKQVMDAFDHLERILGYDTFVRMFPVVLTDNGSEFKDPKGLETALDGRQRTRIFYCDPAASWQKGKIEKNHEMIRYVLPKGSTFNDLTLRQVHLIRDHVNSTARLSLNENSPRDLADLLLPHEALDKLGLRRIPADDVTLTPHLLRH